MKCTPNVKYFWGTYQENFPKIFKQYKFYAPSEYRKTYTNIQNKSEEIRNSGITFSNRILSSGFFPFPAHGEPGQGSANRQSSVLAGKLLFCNYPRVFSLPGFNASADTDCCSLPCFFGDGVLFAAVHFCFVHRFQIFPFFFYFEKQKRRMRAFHPPRRLDAKKISHSPVCDSIFLGLSGQIFSDVRSRPTKILKISAFRDFFVTEPKCQKGTKNRVKPVFLR